MPSPHFPEATSLFNVMCSEQQEHGACFPQSIFHLMSMRFHNSLSLTIPLAWLVEEPSLWGRLIIFTEEWKEFIWRIC